MASLALSMVGTAIAGPLGGAIGGALGGMIDNILFPGPKQPMPPVTTSTYGNAIPLIYGPYNRVGTNMIWSSPIRKVQNKSIKFLTGKGGSNMQAVTYVVDVAFAVAAGPIQPGWLQTLWANGQIIFDATVGTSTSNPDANGVVTWDVSFEKFKDFDSIVVYPGNFTQLPDPTIEAAMGVGNVPAYRGTAYIVINGLKLTTFGNGIPTVSVLVQAQKSEPSINQIVSDLVSRSGISIDMASTSCLTATIKGMALTSQTDAQTQIKDLALVFNFDAAEVAGRLRCTPRGLPAYAGILNDNIGAYVYGSPVPTAYEWPRTPETELPAVAALTFFDPARYGNTNTQAAKRLTGNPKSNINYTVQLTLTSDQARKTCDRMLWEAQIGRQNFKTTVNDTMNCLQPTMPFAFESPAGFETVRITKVARGVNGISEIEGKREYSALYFSSAEGAVADAQRNVLVIGGPVNAPIFIEPPSHFPGINGPTLLIAVSGGEFGIANDAWNGCTVFASTDQQNWIVAGTMSGPSVMGYLIHDLANSGGNPNTTDLLDVSTQECGLEPPTISQYDASVGLMPYWVAGEWIGAQAVQAMGGDTFRITILYRGLFGSSAGKHATGQPFALADSRMFRFPLPIEFVGKLLHFRFVSGGETLDTVVDYTYTPGGGGYGPGTQGAPTQVEVTGVNNAISGLIVNWQDLPPQNNVTAYQIYRAAGKNAPFSSATQIGSVGPSTTQYNDLTATPGQPYTYYVVAVNAAGSSPPSSTSTGNGTTPLISPGPGATVSEASTGLEAFAAGDIVSFVAGGVRRAVASDTTKVAMGFVLVNSNVGDTVYVYGAGAINSALTGLLSGIPYFLSPTLPGKIIQMPLSGITGAFSQQVGFGTAKGNLSFQPMQMVPLYDT